MNQRTGKGPPWAKIIVVLAVAGAVLFGVFLGYLAWSNHSFPVQQKPFGDYAKVASASFNGTEYSFQVQWRSADYLPLYVQLTSPASETANSPVCDLRLPSVAEGQTIYMPFGFAKPTPVLTNVDLSIAVKSVATGGEFTIVYHVDSVSAQLGKIMPSDIVCQQTR